MTGRSRPTRYQVTFTARARKQLAKSDPMVRARILRTVVVLADDPRPPGAKQLVGGEGELRVRAGDYRIVYEVHDGELVVLVLRVAHRREVYR
ncbi:type II toxin-antitoxin system RelE family toxin [Cellulomonas denverensis]|uniref:Type II toxin-antitoxin system RelE/ParE family toxin n=1 Tax=Cellulomonas denverensis TaxID=264297 RepID=A0A7X6R019_9CELL|nr:type II toxin-antitoxin system RelE/ParE family toxin [Cellulomonas denverensis]NKY23707.1 type II toxin-antitoxin system RelE/ParE family toxin [Cellulomonas denverensis]GIG26951.1 translation repressor RelE [Cellulomonas denverensis]